MKLREVLQQHVDQRYDGNISEFARVLGVRTDMANRWVSGAIKRPKIQARRMLARELGLRHVDILALIGDLDSDEVNGDIVPVERSEIDALYRSLPPKQQHMIRNLMEDVAKGAARDETASQPPAIPALPRGTGTG